MAGSFLLHLEIGSVGEEGGDEFWRVGFVKQKMGLNKKGHSSRQPINRGLPTSVDKEAGPALGLGQRSKLMHRSTAFTIDKLQGEIDLI